MPGGSAALLISLIVLIFLSGFFSATETAYSCANRIKLRTLAGNGNKRAQAVLDLAEKNFDRLITTILIGNNIVNLTGATVAALFFAKILINSPVDPSFVSTVVVTIAVLLFGEITPKFIAKTYPEKMAMGIYPVIKICYYIFYPLNILFSGWKWLISKVFHLKNDEIITEEEIMTIVEEAGEDGTLKQEETKLIRSVIEFDDLDVSDILIPRVNISAVELNSSMDEIKEVFERTEFSRLPVYKEDIDSIIGIIHEKDFYKIYGSSDKIFDIIKEPYFTTPHNKISKLLKVLQSQRIQMAFVLDEYGGTLGLVTLEDILEELVGEIYDEHDKKQDFYIKVRDNVYMFDAENAPLDETFEFFNLSDDEGNFQSQTLSGFIVEFLGEIPVKGRKFDYKNLSFEILKANNKTVQMAKITFTPPESED
ncbi:MAG: hemolysin family protein [Treponema sp.]|nr:hemolysin family protein [Treponema sp.]